MLDNQATHKSKKYSINSEINQKIGTEFGKKNKSVTVIAE